MGYSEVPCRLCGVSFNIGRIRRPEDPPSEGWRSTGDGKDFVEGDLGEEEKGCQLVERKSDFHERQSREKKRTKSVTDFHSDDEEDSDYVDEEEVEDEGYEFESDDDLVEDSGEGSSDEEVEDDSQDRHIRYLRGELESENFQESSDEVKKFEHVAGPNCRHSGGYNGHLITAEEMRGCNTLQCLILRDSRWQPEPDDLDFELESKCFLTGISDHMPSRDIGSPSVIPARHELESVNADCVMWEHTGPDDSAMPFHPTCLDIYLRLSRLHFGRVHLDSLRSWYERDGDYNKVYGFPHEPDVSASDQQWWSHENGREYLAANPVFIPRLAPILRSAISENPSFSAQAGAFAVGMNTGAASADAKDPFDILPQELRLEIVSRLGSKDIANLRSATRAFRQLPISLWRRLLREELPWLWEVWSDDPPYIWTTISVARLKEEAETKEVINKEIPRYRNIIREETPGILDMWTKAEEDFLASRPDPMVECQTEALKGLICGLPAERTNWYQVYSEITRNWSDLKGLWNRRRIWKDVEEVISRIRKFHEEGKIME